MMSSGRHCKSHELARPKCDCDINYQQSTNLTVNYIRQQLAMPKTAETSKASLKESKPYGTKKELVFKPDNASRRNIVSLTDCDIGRVTEYV